VTPEGVSVRPMEHADLAAATRASAASFGVDLFDPEMARRWSSRLAYVFGTDPGGAFVAEHEDRVVGVALAIVRESLWCLSLLAVDPEAQSAGAGRALFDRSLDYGEAAHGLITSSNDARAIRLYASRGFALRPALQAEGSLDRRRLPRAPSEVRTGGADELEPLAPISREIRGAPHTRELAYALAIGGHLLTYRDRGFAVARPGHGVWMLVARDDEAASALLWSALELVGDAERPVRWITAEQGWAVDVLVRAGLRLSADGALCVRGRPGPLRPFLPSPPFA
jgi:ribosomal protein S18 acetylase RimI-like enzyme